MPDQENLRVAMAVVAAQLPHLAQGQTDLKDEITDLRREIKDVKGAVDAVPSLIQESLKNYVRVEEFRPVRTIVFGMVGLILSAVMAAILTLVVIRS